MRMILSYRRNPDGRSANHEEAPRGRFTTIHRERLEAPRYNRIDAWFDRFFLERCEVLPVTEQVAHRAGELRGHFRSAGQIRTQADMLIAATAQVSQLALATRNVRDFEGCGLALVNPFETV